MLGCAFLVDYSSHHFSLYHTLQHLSDLEKNDLFNVLMTNITNQLKIRIPDENEQ